MNNNHTIAILGFNHHKLTLSAIQQIRESGCNDPILFYDNGSNPSFEGMINDSNFIYYRKEKNIYVNPAWNEIFDLVKTKYLTLINNDCLIQSYNYFSDILNHMDQNKIIISSCKTKNIQSYNFINKLFYKIKYKFYSTKPLLFSNGARRQGWLMTINLKKYKTLDYKIPSYLKIWYGDDWIWSQIILNNLNYSIYKNRYALHVKSSSTSNLSSIIKEDIKNIEEHGNWYKKITNQMHQRKYV